MIVGMVAYSPLSRPKQGLEFENSVLRTSGNSHYYVYDIQAKPGEDKYD
jgi:hypothetical protein